MAVKTNVEYHAVQKEIAFAVGVSQAQVGRDQAALKEVEALGPGPRT